MAEPRCKHDNLRSECEICKKPQYMGPKNNVGDGEGNLTIKPVSANLE